MASRQPSQNNRLKSDLLPLLISVLCFAFFIMSWVLLRRILAAFGSEPVLIIGGISYALMLISTFLGATATNDIQFITAIIISALLISPAFWAMALTRLIWVGLIGVAILLVAAFIGVAVTGRRMS